MLDRIQLKREAKEITRNAQVSAYLVALIYLVMVMFFTYLEGILERKLRNSER